MHGSYSGAEGGCHRGDIFSPCPTPRLCLYCRSVACGITLSILAVQPKGGTCSTSWGVSLRLYHRSHHQQHFCLFSAIPPHSFQSLEEQFLLERAYKSTLSRKLIISPAQLKSHEQDWQVHRIVPEMFFKCQVYIHVTLG